jgi:hypothetical protein
VSTVDATVDVSSSYAGMEANILSTIMKMIKGTIKNQALTVEDIKKIADDNISYHKSIVECFDAFQGNDMNVMVSSFRRQTAKDKNKFIESYNTLVGLYTGKAKQLEGSLAFSPIYTANKVMMVILKEIRDNASMIFEEGFVNIHNCRISSAAALNVLKQSDLLGDFSCVLWTEMINLISEHPQPTLKYKVLLIKDKLKDVAAIINDVCNKDRAFSFVKEIQKLKKANSDLLLYSNGVLFTKYRLDPASIALVIGYTVVGISLVMALWKYQSIIISIDDWSYNRHLQRKDLHEWMVNYVAILRYELQQKDPNSPEYQKLVKVIQAYDEKIAKYAKKIQQYEEED